MSTHHVWRPRVDSPPLFNPFAPVTQRSPGPDRVDLVDEEEEPETDATPDAGEKPKEDQSPATKR